MKKQNFKIIIEKTIDKQIRYLEFRGFKLNKIFKQHPDIKRLYTNDYPYILKDKHNSILIYFDKICRDKLCISEKQLYNGLVVNLVTYNIIINQIKISNQRLNTIIDKIKKFKSNKKIIVFNKYE